jgi:acyl dehydratase
MTSTSARSSTYTKGQSWTPHKTPEPISLENMCAFSESHVGQVNIHTDINHARARGLPGAIAQGLMTESFAWGVLLDVFGPDAVCNGTEIDMAFIKIVPAGDSVIPHVEVIEVEEWPGGRHKLTLALRCDNQRGEVVAAGTAVVYA